MRGALVLLVLLVFPAAASAATEQIQDGSFESGSSAWQFDAGAERCEAVSSSCGAFPAASGNFYGASKTATFFGANTGEHPIGTITQLVATPELPATLAFKVREIFDVGGIGALDVLLEVRYDGQVIETIDSAADTFGTVVVPIPGALAGPTARPLTFEFSCFNNTAMSEACARLDIDDVSLVTPDPPASEQPKQPGTTPLDVLAPETALSQMKRLATVKAAGKRAKVKARFSSEAGARFECKLDRRPFAACTSPKTLRLKVGKHVFRVRAIDAAGNVDPTPAKATIRVKAAEG